TGCGWSAPPPALCWRTASSRARPRRASSPPTRSTPGCWPPRRATPRAAVRRRAPLSEETAGEKRRAHQGAPPDTEQGGHPTFGEAGERRVVAGGQRGVDGLEGVAGPQPHDHRALIVLVDGTHEAGDGQRAVAV